LKSWRNPQDICSILLINVISILLFDKVLVLEIVWMVVLVVVVIGGRVLTIVPPSIVWYSIVSLFSPRHLIKNIKNKIIILIFETYFDKLK